MEIVPARIALIPAMSSANNANLSLNAAPADRWRNPASAAHDSPHRHLHRHHHHRQHHPADVNNIHPATAPLQPARLRHNNTRHSHLTRLSAALFALLATSTAATTGSRERLPRTVGHSADQLNHVTPSYLPSDRGLNGARDTSDRDMMPLHRIAYQNMPAAVADWTGALQSNKSSDLPASASNPSPRLLDAPPPRPLPDPNPALPLPALELVQPTHDYTVVVYSVILIFGFFSNLYIVLRFLQLRFGLRLNLGAGKDTGLSSAAVLLQHRARLRLLHVALANLLICTISVPMELGWRATIEWRAGNLGCKLLQFGRVLGLYALANCLTAIALDKLLHVRLLLRGTAALGATASGGGWALGSPIHGLLAAGWILSALCSFPQVLVFQAGYSLYSNKVIQCVGMEGFASLGHEHLYNIFMLTGMFLLPAITMLAAYAYIFKHVNSTSDIPDDLESSINQNGAKEETSSLDPQQRARVFSAGGQSRVSAYSHILSLHSGGTGSAAGSGVSSEMELLGGAGAPGTLQVRGADGVYIILDEAFQRDLRVFLAMSLTFICTSLPYVAFTLWYLVDAHSHALIHPIVQELPFVLVLTNTLLIPAIYALRLCAQTT